MGFGCGYNGGSLHSVGASFFGVPTAEGIAFTLGGRQFAVGSANGDLDVLGSGGCAFIIQVEGNIDLLAGGFGLFIGNQLTALLEFHSALIVLDDTGNGNGVANSDHIAAFAGQAVSLDGIVFLAFNCKGNGDVAIGRAIGSVNGHDLTGQGVSAGQEAVFFHSISSIHDLCIGHFRLCGHIALHNFHQVGGVELDIAAIDLQGAGNGDGIANGESGNFSGILALQVVALDGHGFAAFHCHGNGDVAILFVIGFIDFHDLADQGLFGQGVCAGQSVGCIYDCLHFCQLIGINRLHFFPLGVQGVGFVYNGFRGDCFRGAFCILMPADKLPAIADGSGQSTVSGTGIDLDGIGSFACALIVQAEGNFQLSGGDSMFNDPAVLHLSGAVVVTYNTQNSDGVANDGLNFQSVITDRAVSIESAVDVQNLAVSILNAQVAVGGVLDLSDLTGNFILVLGVHIVGDLFTGLVSLIQSDLSAISGGQAQFLIAGNGELTGGEGDDGSVLHLGAVKVADHAKQNNRIAFVGLAGHSIVAVAALVEGAVDVQGVALAVGNGEVAVHIADNRLDNTGNLVLLVGGGVVLHAVAHCISFLDSQLFNGILDGVFPLVQSTALGIFYFALVVGDVTGNGDGIANAKIVILNALACQTEALDGLVGHAFHNDGNGDVAKGGVIGFVDLSDLTGQSCLVGQSLVFLQRISFLHDLLGIGGCFHFGAGLFHLQQRAAFAELHAAFIVYDVALDGDGITDQQGVCAFALNAVAQDGLVSIALNLHSNGNVLVSGVVGGIDLGDLTGQGCLILGRTANFQLEGFLHDGCHVGGSFHLAGRSHRQQSTASLELDLTLVVGQNTGNGDGVAGLQSLSAFALQTVALDGLTLNADHIHGDGDVLIAVVIGSVNLADHTGQGDFLVHGSALLQSIGFFNNGAKVQVHLGNDVLPAEGNHLAVHRNGGSQGVGNFLGGGFVHIDGNAAVSVLDHLDVFFGYVYRPYDFIGDAVYRHRADTGEVAGGLLCGFLVEGLDILQRCVQTGLGAGSAAAGVFLNTGGQAGAKAQAEGQNQNKCE